MTPILGRPGVGAPITAVQGFISRDGNIGFWPRGAVLDGAKTRDPSNTANILALRPGLPLGKVNATGKLATAFMGLTNGALTGAGTTLTLTAAGAAELYRRKGASGTFNLVGPPTTAGVVRTLTATYSAIVGTAVTITALGVNEVQTITPTAAASAGTFTIRVPRPDGSSAKTGPIAYNASVATIQTALDLASGVANGIVLTTAGSAAPISTPVAMVFTFSGTAFAGLPATGAIAVDPAGLTGETILVYSQTTPGVDGRFVTASLVTDTDGSGVPTTFIPDGIGTLMHSDSRDIDLPQVPCSMIVDVSRIVDYPADASLKAWVRNSMSSLAGGKFIFSDAFP